MPIKYSGKSKLINPLIQVSKIQVRMKSHEIYPPPPPQHPKVLEWESVTGHTYLLKTMCIKVRPIKLKTAPP